MVDLACGGSTNQRSDWLMLPMDYSTWSGPLICLKLADQFAKVSFIIAESAYQLRKCILISHFRNWILKIFINLVFGFETFGAHFSTQIPFTFVKTITGDLFTRSELTFTRMSITFDILALYEIFWTYLSKNAKQLFQMSKQFKMKVQVALTLHGFTLHVPHFTRGL